MGMPQDEALLLYATGEEVSVTASRGPKPLSRSAENISIISSVEIDALHAHSLADVLATVPGVQIESLRTPGSHAFLRLQGSAFGHVQVLVDNVPLNTLGDNFADIGLIPARIIERIEIVKGAASSSWGQALGGVINVITKAPEDSERLAQGSITATIGERGTRDTGAELVGTTNRFGYYLSGGYLTSSGLLSNNQSHISNGYAKFVYDLPWQGQLTGIFANFWGQRGDFAYSALDMQENSLPLTTLRSLTLRQPLSERLEVEVNGRYSEKKYDIFIRTIQDAIFLQRALSNESTLGLSTNLLWRGTTNLLAAGVEYEKVHLKQSDSLMNVDTLDRDDDRWGFYLNDTLSFGTLALSPGLRYDLTGNGDNQFSPSLGVTWQVSDNNLLRAYTARGYSLPSLLRNLSAEKVWTSQVGFESSAITNLWLKGTLFRNQTWDIVTYDSITREQRLEQQVKQGGELELRTTPWHDLSFTSGYTYMDARRSGDHARVPDVPAQTVQLGLRYDDLKYLQSVLTGRYIWWNAASNHSGQYNSMVWDLHLTATPFGRSDNSAEFYLSIRNLFDGSQYLDEAFRNAGRWAEVGVRLRF